MSRLYGSLDRYRRYLAAHRRRTHESAESKCPSPRYLIVGPLRKDVRLGRRVLLSPGSRSKRTRRLASALRELR
jgi:hypothetical protein